MNRDQLVAYIATLCTLAIVFIASLVAAAISPGLMGKIGEFGLGTITGGLIGVLRMPTRPPEGNTQADTNLATVLDKLPPQTTGTGPATPVDESAVPAGGPQP